MESMLYRKQDKGKEMNRVKDNNKQVLRYGNTPELDVYVIENSK